MKAVRAGGVQLRILQVLWEHGPLTARALTQLLAADRPIALSTVQTLLRQLEAKQAVTHTAKDRVFYFSATAEPEKVRRTATEEFLQTLFNGSAPGLVKFLLRNKEFNAQDLDAIRQMIDAAEEEQTEVQKKSHKQKGRGQ